MDQLYHIVYPIREANRTRARSPEALCFGLPPLRHRFAQASLEQLGYKRVSHGFRVAENPGDAVAWCRLGFAKAGYHSPDSGLFTAQSFDRIIGDCDAVTDTPCAIFGPEMLQAYPNAKVILNRRKDDEAWFGVFAQR